MPPRVYIAGFTEDVDANAITVLAKPYGEVKSLLFPVNLLTLGPTDAIIDFSTENAASAAAEGLQGVTLDGRPLRVTRQREYVPPPIRREERDSKQFPVQSIGEDDEERITIDVPHSILTVTREVNRELIQQLARRPELLRSQEITSRRFEET